MTNPNNCQHKNIHWEDFFKQEKKNAARCLDCNVGRGRRFGSELQRWYKKKIEEWLRENKITEPLILSDNKYYFFQDWVNFLKKNDYYEHWEKLSWGKIDEVFDWFDNDLLSQQAFIEVAKNIEHFCREFKKEKENNPSIPQPRRERSNNNQRENLQTEISNLENKPNKTPEEEAELKDKQAQLANLVNNPQNNNDNSWVKPALIICGGLLIIVVIVAFAIKRTKRKR